MNEDISEEINRYHIELKQWSNPKPEHVNFDITTNDMWSVIQAYTKQYGWIHHQLESFNMLVSGELQNILENSRELVFFSDSKDNSGNKIKHLITFGKTILGWPQHIEKDNSITRTTPQMCRTRDLTYSVPVYSKVEYHTIIQTSSGVQLSEKLEQVGDVLMFDLPIMLRSKLCVLSSQTSQEQMESGEAIDDLGGYFIINGNEKVIVSQESAANNKIFVNYSKKNESWEAKIISQDYSSTEIKYKRTNTITVKKTSIMFQITQSMSVPLFIMFFALGLSDLNTLKKLFPKKLLWLFESCVEDLGSVVDSTSALVYIGKSNKRISIDESINYSKSLIQTNVFVHTSTDFNKKSIFLCKMLMKLLQTIIGELQEDDKDSLVNKRIDCAGALIKELIETRLREILSGDLREKIEAKVRRGTQIDLIKDINLTKLMNSLRTSFATGNWTRERSGIMIDLHRIGYSTPIAELRRTKLQLSNPTASNLGPHRVHTSFFGYICPSETTDGTDVGLLKQLALLTRVSTVCDPSVVVNALTTTELFLTSDAKPEHPILINNDIVGSSENPESIVEIIRNKRRSGSLPKDISVFLSQTGEVCISTDSGRLCRPLIIVKSGRPMITQKDIKELASGKMSWDNLLSSGKIEYLDTQEIDHMLVAIDIAKLQRQEYLWTHLEIHPIVVFSTIISSLPFPNYNAGVRVMWSGGNFRQALGVYASNYTVRFDTSAHTLCYTNKPIVYTKPGRMLGIDNSGSGQSIIIAIASYGGFNQDDGLVFNASAIQRGMFRSFYYHTHKSVSEEDYARRAEIVNPSKYFGERSKYSKLDSDGVIRVGEVFNHGDILIGKVIVSKTDSSVFVDASEVAHSCGVVEAVAVSTNSGGFTVVKVKTRELRIPEIGDKFCPRHFQKGTIAMVYRQEDMPFTPDGITPDMFLSPYGLTGRMTVGILFEILCGKAAVLNGTEVNSTGFDREEGNTLAHEMQEQLLQHGYSANGTEMLCDGFEGKQIQSKIFLGPMFQQKLKQMSADKIQARSTGRVSERTRQPVSGRAKGGGGRIGEMERDAMISHGISKFVNEKMFDVSDKYSAWICVNCGVFANANHESTSDAIQECQLCKRSNFVLLDMPYTFKLMHQYMYSLGGINLKLGSTSVKSTELDINEFEDIDELEEEEEPPMTSILGEVLNDASKDEFTMNEDTEEENYDEYSF